MRHVVEPFAVANFEGESTELAASEPPPITDSLIFPSLSVVDMYHNVTEEKLRINIDGEKE